MGGNWFTIHRSAAHSFECPSCRLVFDMGHACADHHPSVCPGCGVASVHWSARGGNLTIVPAVAPEPVRRAIEWAQRDLNELDAVELWIALEELFTRSETPAS